jgi:threonine dehydratase
VQSSTIAFDAAELERAVELVHAVVPPTPQYPWPKLSRRAGCTVWVKHENHTPTGAFKVRGGLVYLDGLRRSDPHVRRVVTATRGNHGQSIAFAAARAGLAATVYVPRDEAKHEARRVAEQEGLHFVPAFHRNLVLGVATYAWELLRSGPLDAVYVGVGMGSGISGLIAVRDLLGLFTEIIAVGAAGAPATALSFAAGRAIAAPSAKTFADGLATREPHADAVATLCRGAARMVEVSEDAIAEAIRIYYDDTHQVAEGAGAAPLAALLEERARMAGKSVAVVLTGGNIERARFHRILGGETPSAD